MKILIEVFAAPGCSKCAQKRQALRAVTEELGADRFDWHDINLLENIERAVELGVRLRSVRAPPRAANETFTKGPVWRA